MEAEFQALVREAAALGQTVFLSSHLLDEVEDVCHRVGILREGRLVEVAACRRSCSRCPGRGTWTQDRAVDLVHGGGPAASSAAARRERLRPAPDPGASGRASQFQGANIYWSFPTAAHEVHGAILSKYLALGGTSSRLGLPTSDEFSVTGGRRSNFQHGTLTWNATTGVVTVTYT